MCGIAGHVDFEGRVDPDVVNRMCAAMVHRGPDSRGIWRGEGAVLGMQRLAIIDIAGGDQPMFNEDHTVAVVMNGEIYNFSTLRAELIARGHTFTTRSDTEVLVHLYEEHGERLVEHLRGMFAFAIWDRRRQRLLLARDRVGKKPLFVARQGPRVWFASEMMALIQAPEIRREADPIAIASYLAYQYVPHPMSAFASVTKLPPATTLTIDAAGVHQRRYWSLDYSTRPPAVARSELAERLRALLWEATRIRLISEVPLGAFLSGGVDSSAVVAAMAAQMTEPVKTFSIGFRDVDFDELRYARIVAKHFATDHHEFVVEPHAIDIVPKLARHYGEPFADPSAIPSFYLAQLTSNHVTVALNGDGGDESFAGYRRYVSNDLAAHFNWLPRRLRELAPLVARPVGEGARSDSWPARLQRFARVLAMMPHARYAHWMSAFQPSIHWGMLQPDFLASLGSWHPYEVIGQPWAASTAPSRVERMLDTDVNTYLPADLLVKMDIATMAYSVEARSPLLDHELMEFCAALPHDLKLRSTTGKVLLKSAFRGIVPDAILDRPKMGFGVPLAAWFRDELCEPARRDTALLGFSRPCLRQAGCDQTDDRRPSRRDRRPLPPTVGPLAVGVLAPRSRGVTLHRRPGVRHGPSQRRGRRMSAMDAQTISRSPVAPPPDAFAFGRNWQRYVANYLDPERERIAAASLEALVGELTDKTFLDIGCGSGLFSLCAHRAGASRVISVDVDADAVAATRALYARAGSPQNWQVLQRSVLDPALAQDLPTADVVYSWGVLHHTGDMYTAIRNAAALVKPGGHFAMAIYNRVTGRWLSSQRWWQIKRTYNYAPRHRQRLMEWVFASYWFLGRLRHRQNPMRVAQEYRESRGMALWTDLVDWLGGYPYEFATVAEIVDFCTDSCGLVCSRVIPEPGSGTGNNQFVFWRAPPVDSAD